MRLRGQSNTLPNDATLSVALHRDDHSSAETPNTIKVHFARIRLKAGELKYDFLPGVCELSRTNPKDGSPEFEGPLLASIFSKKCWQGMVVRGPRMFVAFVSDDATRHHSVPMFVEISPTSNSPDYRDPVLEYPADILNLFFSEQTTARVFDDFSKHKLDRPESTTSR